MTALKFERTAVVSAIAARAFGPNVAVRGQDPGLDVRPLLPKYEAAVGQLMLRSVPENLRPKRENSAPKNRTAALEHNQARADEMVAAGAIIREVAAALGIGYDNASIHVRIARAKLTGQKVPGKRPASPKVAQAIALRRKGLTQSQIAAVMGNTDRAVRKLLLTARREGLL